MRLDFLLCLDQEYQILSNRCRNKSCSSELQPHTTAKIKYDAFRSHRDGLTKAIEGRSNPAPQHLNESRQGIRHEG